MKTVYLITRGGFFAFGPGCSLTIDGGSVLAISPSGFGITLMSKERDIEKAYGNLALWSAAIVSAPDGTLLRWDTEKEQVSDELAEAYAFAQSED